MGRFLLPAVVGVVLLLTMLTHAQGQSPGGAADAPRSAREKVRVLAVSTPPLADEQSPEGGLLLSILKASLGRTGAEIQVRWIKEELSPQVLTDPSIDFSLPVGSANCDRPNDLPRSSAMMCDSAVYSDPMLQVIVGLFTLANSSFKFDTDESILGKTVCLWRDHDLSDLNANGRNWASYKRVTVLERPTLLDCVAAVQAHDADAFIATDLEGRLLLRRLGLAQFYAMQARPLATRGMHAVVSRHHARASDLIDSLNQGLKWLKGGDAYSAIVQRHLLAAAAPPPVPAPPRQKAVPPMPQVAATSPAAPPKVAAPPAVLDPVKRQSALKFLKRGDEELAQGRVAPARLLYERAAEMGLAQAAMAIAATYDAAELNQPHLRDVQPDPGEAKRWYERARALGATDANARLQRLGSN
jgi:hypothetical protein